MLLSNGSYKTRRRRQGQVEGLVETEYKYLSKYRFEYYNAYYNLTDASNITFDINPSTNANDYTRHREKLRIRKQYIHIPK